MDGATAAAALSMALKNSLEGMRGPRVDSWASLSAARRAKRPMVDRLGKDTLPEAGQRETETGGEVVDVRVCVSVRGVHLLIPAERFTHSPVASLLLAR